PPPLGGLAQASLQQLVQVLERRDVLGQRGSFEVLGSRERSLELVGALGLPGVGAGLDVHVAHAIAPTSSGRVRTLMSTPASARAVGRSASSLAAHAAAHAARSSSRSSTTSPCSGRSSPPEPSTTTAWPGAPSTRATASAQTHRSPSRRTHGCATSRPRRSSASRLG